MLFSNACRLTRADSLECLSNSQHNHLQLVLLSLAPPSPEHGLTCMHDSCFNDCAGSADERMMQLLRNMNRLLELHPQSRRRHLAFHTPIIVPVYPQAGS